jgi:methionine synthase I (cobalamin-dependent)
MECTSARTWKWGWDIQGRGTMAILAVVNVESVNVLSINCKMGLQKLQRKVVHVSRLFIELIPTN